MNDIIGNVAQELADHLDDLRDTEHGVTDYDGDGRSFPVTEVGDPEVDLGVANNAEGFVSFFTVVGGQRVRVTVSEVAQQPEPKRLYRLPSAEQVRNLTSQEAVDLAKSMNEHGKTCQMHMCPVCFPTVAKQ